jgi:hypothetical protein
MWPTCDVQRQQELYKELYQGVPSDQMGFFQENTPIHPGLLPGHDWRGSEYLCIDPEAAGMSYILFSMLDVPLHLFPPFVLFRALRQVSAFSAECIGALLLWMK